MKHLLNVNGEDFPVKDALEIDILHDNKFLTETIDNLLIRQHAAKVGITNTDEELQVAVDELRYQRNLETVEKTLFWLKSNNVSPEGVQTGTDMMLLRNKLRNSFSDKEIEAYFAENKLAFDKVELYSIRLDDEATAQEIHAQITEEGLSFYQAAVEYSKDERTAKIGGYVGDLKREDVTGEVEAIAFAPNAKPGTVIAPVKTEKGYNIFKIGAITKADLAKEKSTIQFALFTNLLNKLKADARITYPVLED